MYSGELFRLHSLGQGFDAVHQALADALKNIFQFGLGFVICLLVMPQFRL
ncbi:MAG: hypothetical protein AAF669_06820 [Pseudomonadota bacterium]